MAERQLMNEYRELSKLAWTNIELVKENIFEWTVAIVVLNPDSEYYGGYFKAKMEFPKNYPFSPPDFRFMRPLYHPNIYPDGRLCISILHPPGDDEMSGEDASERWSPVRTVESILLSILCLLDNPEVSSPANVDAGIMLRSDGEKYLAKVKADLEISKKDIPSDYVMPKHEDAFKTKKDDDFNMTSWDDSDVEDDFGGSDSEDVGMDSYDEDDEEDDLGDSGFSDTDNAGTSAKAGAST